MTIKDFFSFRRNKYLWLNLIAMAVVVIVLPLVVLKGINTYTRHGEAVMVPDAKGMSITGAERLFRNHGLECVVADSSYVKTKPAGCVLEHSPAAGQKVKEGRAIYLTINTVNVPLQAVPDVADNSSLRQAEARMLASGFKLDMIEYIPGEKDWVYGVKYKEHELAPGEKVPVGSLLRLVVGGGDNWMSAADSLAQDSLGVQVVKVVEEVKPGKSETDESWFD